MNQELSIKLTNNNGIFHVEPESYPFLYENLKTTVLTQVQLSEHVNPAEIEQHGYGAFEWAFAPTVNYNQSVESVGITKHDDGFWRPTFLVRDATAEEISIRTHNQAQSVRTDMYWKLGKSYLDQQHIDNVNISSDQWDLYRQQVADILTQPNFPWDVTFPVSLVHEED